MHGLEDRVHELNEAAAPIAREVADEHGVLVAGDLGPTGELLEPLGTMTPADAQALFEEQLRGLRRRRHRRRADRDDERPRRGARRRSRPPGPSCPTCR